MLPGSTSLSWTPSSASALTASILKQQSAAKAAGSSATVPAAPAAEPADDDDDSGCTFVCEFTKKRFKSKAAYENYTKSKKYRELVAKAAAKPLPEQATGSSGPAATGSETASAGASAGAAAPSASSSAATSTAAGPPPRRNVCYIHPDGSTSSSRVAAASAAAAAAPLDGPPAASAAAATLSPRAASAAEGGADDDAGSASTSSDGEWEDDDEPWEPRWSESLFDGRCSGTFEANVAYMRLTHSFHVPSPPCLLDGKGLFAFLQERIERHATCIYCRRRFASCGACRDHMHAKGHCKLNLEDELAACELATYIDFEQTGRLAAAARAARAAGRIDHLGELILPNGQRLGHRALRVAYRQSYRSEDTRVAVVAARQANAQRRQQQGGSQLASLASSVALRIAHREEARRRNGGLVAAYQRAKGTSKALASNYHFKADFADNKHARAIQHHGYGGFSGGAHYTMAGSRQFQRGVRIKGVVSRHSVQGARLGAMRQAKAQARQASRGSGAT